MALDLSVTAELLVHKQNESQWGLRGTRLEDGKDYNSHSKFGEEEKQEKKKK